MEMPYLSPVFGLISVQPGVKYGEVPIANLPPLPVKPGDDAGGVERGLQEDVTEATDPTLFEPAFNGSFLGVDIFNSPFLGSNVPYSQQIPSSMMEPNEFSFQDTLAIDIDEDWSKMLQQLD
ncbi:uncharacterized protein N7458_006398 [Penicillium daleae]|uniref:Uncharacterized protein n=1 Tax=Penicillium daleae TaxID=63821 RepID=A0AAD6G205_9EURO|nr:uncharacterized protein N7458_006398 [Penicillium daleae]KAJ5449949.1 hypothetical protein N7458_006398 [Penicillium daleae]